MKKYVIALAATITLITVHQTVLTEGWDWFGIKSLYDDPYLNVNDINETAIRAAKQGQYAGRRQSALYAPLVVGAAYAGHKGWQAVRNWYSGPVKVMEKKVEHINKLVKAALAATENHITQQSKVAENDPASEKGKKAVQQNVDLIKIKNTLVNLTTILNLQQS